MIKLKDIVLIGVNLLVTLVLLLAYEATVTRAKPIAMVNVKAITSEFLSLATRVNLQEEQMNSLVGEYATSLDDGVKELAKDHVIVSTKFVVSEEPDLTNELRDYIALRITKGSKK